MKPDPGNSDPASPFHRFLLRAVHAWCQGIEKTLEKCLLDSCPDPVVGARVHPFMKQSRMKGNKALEMSLINRFSARGSGFVSLKDTPLSKLGIVPPRSTLATRTSSEYTTRNLLKTAEFMAEATQRSTVINFCFDLAFVGEEHVPCPESRTEEFCL